MPKITLHKYQSEPIRWLFDKNLSTQMRFAVVVASRGWGKSVVGATASYLAACELEKLPSYVMNKQVCLVASTHEQVSTVFRPIFEGMFNLSEITKPVQRPNLHWVLPNGTKIVTASADSYERMRGQGYYLVVADEIASWSIPDIRDAWEATIEPTVVSRWSPKHAEAVMAPSAGRGLIISTVRGRDFLYDLSLRQEQDERWKTFTYTYKQSPTLDRAEVERSRANYDPIKFAREYECSFEDSGLTVFHQFKRENNVRPVADFAPGETVHAAIDFNVMINAASFSAMRDGQIHVIDEMRGTTNTDELVKNIKLKYHGHPIVSYPDPAGNNRSTKAPIGQTDFTIIRNSGIQIRAKNKAPSVLDSAAAVNKMLRNAAGETNMYVHPRCVETIRSLERTCWNESIADVAIIDKKAGVEHFSDGIRYMVDYAYPIVGQPVIIQSPSF